MDKKNIEKLEKHYLEKMYWDLTIEKDKMIRGILTKEDIRVDWENKVKRGISESATGIERIFYWLFNQLGAPNSCPVGSDLFFETYDAFIHIDIKSVQTDNIGDFNKTIFVGNNQNSYAGIFNVGRQNKRIENYNGNLPHFYTKKDKVKKPTLTYFITVLHDNKTGEIVIVYITCMPNGALGYTNILCAGKNPGKIRFKHLDTHFINLNNEIRTKIVFYNEEYIIKNNLQKKLKSYKEIYENNIKDN